MSNEILLTTHDLLKILKAKKSTFYNWVKQGVFPKGIRIGGNVRWHKEDVDAWIEQKRKESKED